ncbi:MAG: hypothetical protein H6R12_1422 [Proteobacteria bacterium]|nr:hypothetical protein [Pseudomonadota bacterium]
MPDLVDLALEARVAEVLPGEVEQALPARLAQELPGAVEQALPARLAEVLPEKVEQVLQPRLEAALQLQMAEHLAWLQPQLAEALRSWLTQEVPQIIAKELEGVSDHIAVRLATEFRAAVLPELDELMTTPQSGSAAATGR